MKLQLIDGIDHLKPTPWCIKGDSVYGNDLTDQILSNLREARRAQKIADAKVKKYEDQIKQYMGNQENLLDKDDLVTCSWKESVGSRFDTSAFKEQRPKMYEKFLVESRSRRFLIK